MKKTVILKDVLNVTLTEVKKSVKTLSDRQLNDLINKVGRLKDYLFEESNKRYKTALEAELDAEIEAVIDEIADEDPIDDNSINFNDDEV